MKVYKTIVMVSFAIVFTSCGGKKGSSDEAIVLKPETTHIKGDLGEYFDVVDKEYTVTHDWGDIVSIEVKRTGADYAFELNGIEPYGTYGRGVTGNAGFGIEILDENGNLIEKCAATASGLSGMYSSDDMKEALKLKTGETGIVRWSFHFDSDKKPAKFRLTSSYEKADSSKWDSSKSDGDDSDNDLYSSDDDESDNEFYSSSDDYDEPSMSSSTGSEDWDALLDSYDSYVTKYIHCMQKAANGDVNALEEYPALMEKAQELSSKMQNAQGNMSSTQWERYMKIVNKMTNAAFKMQ